MADPMDIHIGQQIFRRRKQLGFTQQQLAEQIGVRFQQVQKYEAGRNRISASRLWRVARFLKCPVGAFFKGIEP